MKEVMKMKNAKNGILTLFIAGLMIISLFPIFSIMGQAQANHELHPMVRMKNDMLMVDYCPEVCGIANFSDDASIEGWRLNPAVRYDADLDGSFSDEEIMASVIFPSVSHSLGSYSPMNESLHATDQTPGIIEESGNSMSYRSKVSARDNSVYLDTTIDMGQHADFIVEFSVRAGVEDLENVKLNLYLGLDISKYLNDDITINPDDDYMIKAFDPTSEVWMGVVPSKAPSGYDIDEWIDGPGPVRDIWERTIQGDLGNSSFSPKSFDTEAGLSIPVGDISAGSYSNITVQFSFALTEAGLIGFGGNHPPALVDFHPSDDEVTAYVDESLEFSVMVADMDEDPIDYQWKVDGDIVSSSPSFTYMPTEDDIGTHEVMLSAGDGTSSVSRKWSVEVTTSSSMKPGIESPDYGTSFIEGTEISFKGYVNTPGSSDFNGTVTWTSDMDGNIGQALEFTSDNLSKGQHRITLKADNGQESSECSILIIIYGSEADVDPQAVIAAPQNGKTYQYGESIDFQGHGTLPGVGKFTVGLKWTSSIDGLISKTDAFSVSILSPGKHEITLNVTGPTGKSASNSILVEIVGGPVAGGHPTFLLLDEDGKAVSQALVTAEVGNKTYEAVTNEDGYAVFEDFPGPQFPPGTLFTAQRGGFEDISWKAGESIPRFVKSAAEEEEGGGMTIFIVIIIICIAILIIAFLVLKKRAKGGGQGQLEVIEEDIDEEIEDAAEEIEEEEVEAAEVEESDEEIEDEGAEKDESEAEEVEEEDPEDGRGEIEDDKGGEEVPVPSPDEPVVPKNISLPAPDGEKKDLKALPAPKDKPVPAAPKSGEVAK